MTEQAARMQTQVKIKTVGIVSRPRRDEAAAVVPQLVQWLEAHKIEVYHDAETSAVAGSKQREKSREELPGLADVLIVLGGDGTLLAAARMLGDRSVPILPVNLGGLGFLTSVQLAEMYPILEQVIAGQNRISERTLIEAELIRGGKRIERQRALNDAVINKGALARIIDMDLHIDGGYVCSYKADGLILSTPTGSTAYSLSAGGPIIYPVVEAFVVTPICPHSLTNRPLVIPDTVRIEVETHGGEEPAFLTLDGQIGFELKAGDRVGVTKAPKKLRLVRPARRTYFEILRNKLKWGER